MYLNIALIALLVLLYSLFAGKVERGPVSSAMVFLVIGLLLGPFVFHVLKVKIEIEGYKMLAEFALAMVLYSDAVKTNLKVLRTNVLLPTRLLLVGLPLSIVFGTLLGKLLFPQINWIELAILATVLAPTDAALGEPVVSNKKVPARIREGINVESGLNDGICVPILLLLLALHFVKSNEEISFAYGAGLFAKQIGIGAGVGIAIAFISDRIMEWGTGKAWLESSWKSVVLVLMAVSSFALAQTLGGSGFIAAFVGGLFFGGIYKEHKVELVSGAEGFGKIVTAVVWIVFGSVITGRILPQLTWQIALYALLSLTIIRIVPVFFSLLGNKSTVYEKFFMAWFGPRGLANIVFAVIVLEEHLPHGNTIVLAACLTILLSVFSHGLTANGMSNKFAKE